MTKTAADRHREGYVHWDASMLGWKYNMDNIQAAILIPQLKRLDAKLREREKLARRYAEKLNAIPAVRAPVIRPGSIHARDHLHFLVYAVVRERLIAQF